LQRWHRVDLFKQDGYDRLLRSLAAVAAARGGVRYDGFYAKPASAARFTEFLRFYPDGTVVTTTTSGSAGQITSWFHKDHPDRSKGSYDIDGDRIAFATTASYGTIEYAGTIRDDGTELHLHTHSRINGHQSDGVWRFIPVKLSA